jgi:hypothetical protein
MSKSIAEQLSSIKPLRTNRYKNVNEQYKKEIDGVGHINICNKGKTEIGRLLSLENEQKFVHPILGPFKSLTNYWAYLKSKSHNSALRYMRPEICMSTLKNNKDIKDNVENFKALIVRGCYYKIISNNQLKEMVIESTLPFQMYYTKVEKEMNNGKEIKYEVKVPHKYSYWLINGYEEIRSALKENREPDITPFMSNSKMPLYQDFADSLGVVEEPEESSSEEELKD